jgi:DNA-binding NarL/FixJ family response regulator
VTDSISVLLVDDDALVRVGLAMILRGAPDLRLVAQVNDGNAVEQAVAEHRPDVVLMDIRMTHVDGVTATRRLRGRPGAPEVIMLTTFDMDDYVIEALRAGASGFLLKDTPPDELVRAIRLVASGEPILSPSITRRLIAQVTGPKVTDRQSRATSVLDQLSEREKDIVRLIGEGKSNARIGEELYMSIPTVKAHVSKLLAKLNLNNRVQIALLANDAALPRDDDDV